MGQKEKDTGGQNGGKIEREEKQEDDRKTLKERRGQ